MTRQLLAISIALIIGSNIGTSAPDALLDFDEQMMRSTVKIQSGVAFGTGFILLAPIIGSTNGLRSYVLVTAAHVLARMPSTNVTLSFRSGHQSIYNKVNQEVPIRLNGTNLWTQHPTADVAALRIAIPSLTDLGNLPTELLREDKFLEDFRIHPGDEVRVLGFPHGYEANNAGFPVLRSGRIASYPLTPTTINPTFMIDFRVFPGNSGGPVYISERRAMTSGMLDTVQLRGILGLVSQEAKVSETITSINEHSIRTYQLGLGIIVPSRFIRETIEMLPSFSP